MVKIHNHLSAKFIIPERLEPQNLYSPIVTKSESHFALLQGNSMINVLLGVVEFEIIAAEPFFLHEDSSLEKECDKIVSQIRLKYPMNVKIIGLSGKSNLGIAA